MARYRKKPVVIEAWQLSLSSTMPVWMAEEWDSGGVRWAGGAVFIDTLEGTMKANLGDWIIRGVNGEIYPCKDEIFKKTYEPVREPAVAE